MKKRICGLAAVLTAGVCLCTGLSLPASAYQHSEELNQYAVTVGYQVNRERAAYGVYPLYFSSSMDDAAETRAIELASNFSSTRPDGSDWSTVLDENNIDWYQATEIISQGYDNPKELVASWMNKPNMRSCVLDEKWDYLGISVLYNGNYYSSQIFGNCEGTTVLEDGVFPNSLDVTGDADYDGTVDINDAYLTLRAYSMVSAGAELPMCNLQQQNCDIDGDGSITLQDALNILTYYSYASAGKSIQWSDLL